MDGDQGDPLLLLWEGLSCNPIFLGLQGDSISPICGCSGEVQSTMCFLHISTLNAQDQELHGFALVKREKRNPIGAGLALLTAFIASLEWMGGHRLLLERGTGW